MDKQQVISFIQGQLEAGKITKGDLMEMAAGTEASAHFTASPSAVPPHVQEKEESSRNLISTFYAIGAIIAIIGAVILIAQHWEQIGFIGRIAVSLGIAFASYVLAIVLNKPDQKSISQVLFTISAALSPLGAYVLLNEAHLDFGKTHQLITSAILFVLFATALFLTRRNILVIIATGFATWFYYILLLKVIGDFDYFDSDVLKWATILLGAAYLFIGYGYKSVFVETSETDKREKKAIQNLLYGAGTLAILAAGASFGGIFDLIFILFIFAAFYGSVFLKSRAMLSLAAIFLVGHILKITSKYFLDSISWPVILIFVGFVVIGIGYLTFYLNKKFISNQ